MLGEGFLRVLRYREERRIASSTQLHRTQTRTVCEDPVNGTLSGSNPGPHTLSAKAGPKEEELGSTQSLGLGVAYQPHLALSIPGCSPALALEPPLSIGLVSCSLLQHYPDLRLGQEPGEPGDSGSPLRSTDPGHSHLSYPSRSGLPLHSHPNRQELQGEQGSSVPDQGYLVMGASVTRSLDVPGSGMEPMSNSLLNGLLEKQLDEVYLQHLTDSLARCSSHLGNSLLRGLVPPPQPSSQAERPDSLEERLGQGLAGEHSQAISYLRTQNTASCSSHFSSPVLRISEDPIKHMHGT